MVNSIPIVLRFCRNWKQTKKQCSEWLFFVAGFSQFSIRKNTAHDLSFFCSCLYVFFGRLGCGRCVMLSPRLGRLEVGLNHTLNLLGVWGSFLIGGK